MRCGSSLNFFAFGPIIFFVVFSAGRRRGEILHLDLIAVDAFDGWA
jgi:hypothetical protein